MAIVDCILNLAALLLWLNWRAEKADPVEKRKPATLIGTLRRADSKSRHWQIPAAIAGLIFLRAIFYWKIGSAINWSAQLNLGVIELSFRSAHFGRMLIFSICSFAETLWIFYLCLLLLSFLNGPLPFHIFVQAQLGGIDRWRRVTKIFLPFVATAISWWLASWPLAWLKIIPPPTSVAQRLGESAIIGMAGYLPWKFAAAALLILHVLNSYIYFGRNPIWNYVNAEAQTLLWPLKKIPLKIGKADFAPVIGMALVFLIAGFAARGLQFFYAELLR